MARTTIKVLRTDHPGSSLAIWLAVHHPDLFVATVRAARAARTGKTLQGGGLGRLAQGDSLETFTPDLQTVSFDPGSVSVPFTPDLQTISFDPGSMPLPDNLISDSSGILDTIGSGVTSAGTTVGSALGSGSSGLLSLVGQAGSYLASPSGIKTLSSLGQSYFQSQTANANAQTQAAVLQTQIARAATGQPVAPITYTTAANGQLVPVYTSSTPQGALYRPLTPQGLASLTPSSVSVFLSQYGMYLVVAAVAVVALGALHGKG